MGVDAFSSFIRGSNLPANGSLPWFGPPALRRRREVDIEGAEVDEIVGHRTGPVVALVPTNRNRLIAMRVWMSHERVVPLSPGARLLDGCRAAVTRLPALGGLSQVRLRA